MSKKRHFYILFFLVGMLAYVSIAPFNPFVFFPMGVVAVAIGIWGVYNLRRVVRERKASK